MGALGSIKRQSSNPNQLAQKQPCRITKRKPTAALIPRSRNIGDSRAYHAVRDRTRQNTIFRGLHVAESSRLAAGAIREHRTADCRARPGRQLRARSSQGQPRKMNRGAKERTSRLDAVRVRYFPAPSIPRAVAGTRFNNNALLTTARQQFLLIIRTAWRGVAWRGMAWRGAAWHGAPPGLCVCAVHYRGSSMKSLNDRLSLFRLYQLFARCCLRRCRCNGFCSADACIFFFALHRVTIPPVEFA